MSGAVSGLVGMALCMLMTVLVFQVADTTTDWLTDTVTVVNNGETVVAGFTDMDLSVYTTDGTVSISPDDRGPNPWNPDETATITFTLASAPTVNTRGTVLVATPLGIADSSYFNFGCAVRDTGYLDPANQADDTGGDVVGLEADPTTSSPTMFLPHPTEVATTLGTGFTTMESL